MTIGKLSMEEGLNVPNDWTMGWIWYWKGRRSCIAKDMTSPNTFMNFTGHVILVTAEGQFISYQYDPKHEDTNNDLEWCNDFYEMVRTKNRKGLKWFAVVGKLGIQDTCPIKHAIEAGIHVVKFQTLYSPRRILELLADPKYVRSCRYSWNVNVNKRHLNCNTFFQAWHVTRDLPFIKKMSDFSTVTDALFQKYSLTTEDCKMMNLLHNKEKEEEDYLGGRTRNGTDVVMKYQKKDKNKHVPQQQQLNTPKDKGTGEPNVSIVTTTPMRRRRKEGLCHYYIPSRL